MFTPFRLAKYASAPLFALPLCASAQDDAALRDAQALLSKTPLADGHNDLPMLIAEDAKATRDVDACGLHRTMKQAGQVAKGLQKTRKP